MDARDFIRGDRPWGQFLTYAHYVAEIDGSALWAAQLSDDRFLPDIRKQLAALKGSKDDKDSSRPALAGYSREVDGLFRVATELRLLRAEMGKWESPPQILGPLFPSERIKALEAAQEVTDLTAAIAEGHRNWEEAKHHA